MSGGFRYRNQALCDNTRLFVVETLTSIYKFTCNQATKLVVMIEDKYAAPIYKYRPYI